MPIELYSKRDWHHLDSHSPLFGSPFCGRGAAIFHRRRVPTLSFYLLCPSMIGAEDARRTAAKACDAALARVGKNSADVLNAVAHEFPLLDYIHKRFDEWAPGISCMGALLVSTACLNVLTGPVAPTLITSVREDGSQATWSQPAGDFFLFVSGPGQFKTASMNTCIDALNSVVMLLSDLKASLGGTVAVHKWVDHIDVDTIFRDGSTSAWFERFKANPKLFSLFYACDEVDVVFKRVRSDKAAGELAAWLGLWNTGGPLYKNTGQINVGVDHVFGIVACLGQYQCAFEMGCDEESNGRGFGPRFIMGAGHIEQREWPGSDKVDYFKMLLDRFVGKNSHGLGEAEGADRGTQEYAVNGLAQLYLATLVVLHVFPAKSVRALRPQMEAMVQKRAASNMEEPDAPSTPTREPAPCKVRTPDTDLQAQELGWCPAESPCSSEPTSISSDANSNGKRDASSDSSSNAKQKAAPTRKEQDARWQSKLTPMFFTADAQDAVAQWNNKCEKEERACLATGGTPAMAPYWRKAKDHLLRLVGLYHLGGLAVELLNVAELSPQVKIRPRHVLKLVSRAVELPHVDGRYVVTGEGLPTFVADTSVEQTMDGALAHLIDAPAVQMTRVVLEQHVALAAAVHGATVNRCAALFNGKGYLVTSVDAHAGVLGPRLETDSFAEIAKAAMRLGVGIYLALDPVRWKGTETSKTGGHIIHVFIKYPVTDVEDMTEHKRRAMTKACVPPNGTLSTVVGNYYANIGPQDGQRPSAAIDARMKMPAKVMMAAAAAARRIDLLLPPDDAGACSSYRAAYDQSTICWGEPKTMENVHAHAWQLAVLAAKNIDFEKGTGTLANNVSLLAVPEVPPSAGAHSSA